jgi:hypothetical protein
VCSEYDPNWSDAVQVTPEQAAYAETRVDELLRPLRDADIDGSLPGHIAWLRDDLVMVYQRAIVDNTWSQLEDDIVARSKWVADQLGTPRRRAVFGELLMHTGEGDVWAWVTRWNGLRPMDVGEDPNVVSAWETGVFDPSVSAADSDQSSTEVAYTEYHDETSEPREPAYTEYRDD